MGWLAKTFGGAHDNKPPQADPDLREEMTLSLKDVIKVSAQHTDLIHIGDTDHRDSRIASAVQSREMMVAYAEAGVTHLLVEEQPGLQQHADKLAAGEIDRNGFIKGMKDDGGGSDFGNKDKDLGTLADGIKTGSTLGIKTHFAQMDNGMDEAMKLEDASMKLEEAFERASAGEYADKKEMQNEIKQLGAEARQSNIEFHKARLDDKQLAAFVDKTIPKGEKGIMFYGTEHGSTKNDLNEMMATRSMKIDIYPDRAAYEQGKKEVASLNKETGLKIGEDRPELIYIASEKKLYTTPDTPADLTKDLQRAAQEQKLAAPAPAPDKTPDPQAPQQQRPVQQVGMAGPGM